MPIQLPPLPYAPEALEPHISARTVELHHERHEAGYIDRVNAIAAELKLTLNSLGEAVTVARRRGHTTLFNMAAQAWNHGFYWESLRPGAGGPPHGNIATLIDAQLGGYESFAAEFRDRATAHFGSGWAWLVATEGKLSIVTTQNAELPTAPQVPLLVIDVWEHAYYLDYRNRRAAYVTAVVDHLLNWDWANACLQAVAASPPVRAGRARGR
jgi:Fe-Mn family superoxide dismutase